MSHTQKFAIAVSKRLLTKQSKSRGVLKEATWVYATLEGVDMVRIGI